MADAGPVLQLLSRALEFWLRQQCETIERLEIRLGGSAQQLLRGRLAGVSLQARRVRYQGLELEEVRLSSDTIRVRMGTLLRRRSLELENAFEVRGSVCFSGEGLNRSLCGPRWSDLGDSLAEELLGLSPLAGLRIEEDRLILQARGAGEQELVERATRLAPVQGALLLSCLEGEQSAELPIDPAISIERTSLGGGRLELAGVALVSA
jgi:hypothetical protein